MRKNQFNYRNSLYAKKSIFSDDEQDTKEKVTNSRKRPRDSEDSSAYSGNIKKPHAQSTSEGDENVLWSTLAEESGINKEVLNWLTLDTPEEFKIKPNQAILTKLIKRIDQCMNVEAKFEENSKLTITDSDREDREIKRREVPKLYFKLFKALKWLTAEAPTELQVKPSQATIQQIKDSALRLYLIDFLKPKQPSSSVISAWNAVGIARTWQDSNSSDTSEHFKPTFSALGSEW